MAAAFREVLAAYGVDEDVKNPAMMIPLHGSNVVALEGGPDLIVVPVNDRKKALKIEKIDKGQLAQFMTGANKLSNWAREVKALSKDTTYFKITGAGLSGHDGVILNAVNPSTPKKSEATITAVVLGEKVVKIAIRAVQTSGDKGVWINHGKKTFDAKELHDQMNAVWVPQANLRFELESTGPFQIEEKELADELKRTGYTRDDFLKDIHLEAFEPLFSKNSVDKKNYFTIFLVQSFVTRPPTQKSGGEHPAGGTPLKGHFCLVADRMERDPVREAKNVPTIPGIVPAHEAGHFMGSPGHVASHHGVMLMAEGGPTTGFGKVTVELILQEYNANY
jgi:hypothetical protein